MVLKRAGSFLIGIDARGEQFWTPLYTMCTRGMRPIPVWNMRRVLVAYSGGRIDECFIGILFARGRKASRANAKALRLPSRLQLACRALSAGLRVPT